MRQDTSTKAEINPALFLKSLIFGVTSGCVVSVVLLILFAIILTKLGSAATSVIQILAICAAGLGAFFASYISLRICKVKGLIYGSVCGTVMFLLFTVVGFIVSRDHFTAITLIKLAVMLLTGAAGGVLGVNKQRR